MSGSVLDRYALKRAEEPETEETDNETVDYRAYGISRPAKRYGETRLMICYPNGTISLPTYSYLVDVLCTSHQQLSLIYTNCIINLEGRNLDVLLPLLQDEKLRYVRVYKSGDFPEHPANDEVVITDIRRETPKAAMNR